MRAPQAQSLHRDYYKILRLTALIVPLLLIGPMVPVVIFADALPLWQRLGLVAAVVITAALLMQLYIRRWYARYYYWLQAEGLYIGKGVFWRSLKLIPRNRVQHIDISSGPLDRRYDLAKLIVHTAGTRNASTSLPGLQQHEATALRRELLDLEEDDAV